MSIEIGQLQCQRNTSVSGIPPTSISWNFSTFDARMPVLFCRSTDPKTMNILMMCWKDIFARSLWCRFKIKSKLLSWKERNRIFDGEGEGRWACDDLYICTYYCEASCKYTIDDWDHPQSCSCLLHWCRHWPTCLLSRLHEICKHLACYTTASTLIKLFSQFQTQKPLLLYKQTYI